VAAGESPPYGRRVGRRWGLALALATCLAILLTPSAASAAVTLTLSTSTLHFPNADPDTSPTINATENPLGVTVRVTQSQGRQIQLTALAAGDLRSGANVIAISAVRWTAQGSGFVSGTLSRTTPQLMGQWAGNGTRTGTQQFQLTNSWSYATGNYSQTVLYTLVSL
jgi:hypothetical protein